MEENLGIYCRSASGTLEKFIHSPSSPTPSAQRSLFRRVLIRNVPQDEQEQEEEEESSTFPAYSAVPSLYEQCMDLLAKFTHCFDSLEDFPLDFGRDIFHRAESRLSVDCESTRQSLQMFSSAYPLDFLPSCCLSSCLRLINDREVGLPALLARTVQLEVTDCHIDDGHDLLGELIKLDSLEDLSLARNYISDSGLKRLILPVIGKKALRKLKYLDLSFNNLNTKSLKRMKFLSIESLVLGESDFPSVDLCDTALGFEFVRVCPRIKQIKTVGFASSLLSNWKDSLRKPKASSSDATTRKFYSSPRVPTAFPEKTRSSGNRIMYSRKMKKSTENIINTNLVKPKQVTKRKLDCDDISEEILADLANTEAYSNQKSKKYKPNVDPGSDNIHSSVEENILKLYL